MSGKRIFPRSNLFDGISSLAPGTIVFSDTDGNIQSVGVGNGLSVDAGVLNVTIPNTYDPTFGANIGSGTGLYSAKVGNTLQFKTLKSNDKIIFTSDADSVTINVVDVADLVHLHFIADVVGLQTALNGKEPTILPSDSTTFLRGDKTWQPITSFASASHTHTSSSIVDFTSSVNALIGSAVLDDLSNVSLTTPSNGQALTFNGLNWVNATVASSFLSLTDAPNNYSGVGGYLIRVNAGETGLEFANIISTDATFAADSNVLVPSQSAVKSAISGKQDTLVSGTNIKTINGTDITGSGNIQIPYLPQKAGTVAAGGFSGNPKKTTITFGVPFADANYSVSIVGVNSRSWSIESITASGFVLNTNANAALTGNVYWVANKHRTDMSGVITAVSFSGNPKKAVMTFNAPLPDANYSVTVVGIDSRSWSIETITSNSFTINANANTTLTGNVYWTVTKHGEII